MNEYCRTELNTLDVSWFAIRVKSNCERVTSLAIQHRGYEEFLPLLRRRSRSSPSKAIELPLFPGYVFARFNPSSRLSILMLPGVVHIVGINRRPIPVDDTEIAAVRAVIESGLPAQAWPFLQRGQHVLIEKGPLRGVEGVVTEAGGQCRLVVSITLLQRSVSVEMDYDWVRGLSNHLGRPRVRFANLAAPAVTTSSGLSI